MGNVSESSKSMDDHLGGQKIVLARDLPQGCASKSASQEDVERQNHGGGSSPDANR